MVYLICLSKEIKCVYLVTNILEAAFLSADPKNRVLGRTLAVLVANTPPDLSRFKIRKTLRIRVVLSNFTYSV